ncbi:hypothetical protein EV188_101675 [Actinomycetospora succinea]|uniref:Uncharacterized protein n=1 Tax=Actinomycetospora succinea TaxID=663603 RepID=A0A4R6VN56_9PSEU|nr:hypothetical protein [Actinomycetospora succinea]TDQ65423.1 hypothetical protein EV188_101675 [Actinomycetospora succinea]
MTDRTPSRPEDAAAARRRALSASAQRDTGPRLVDRVRPDERRRYVFQLWTTSAFAAAWLLVYVLTGSWIFLALAGGFLLLTVLAAAALRVLRRSSGSPTERT